MTKPVLLIRADANEPDAEALKALGLGSVIDPYINIAKATSATDAVTLLAAINNATHNTWMVATSANAMRCLAELVGEANLRAAMKNPNLRFAAVGERTAKALVQLGAQMVAAPEQADSQSLAQLLVELTPGTAIIPSGQLALKELPAALTSAGWQIISGVVYTTVTVPTEPTTAAAARAGEFSAVVFRSPSAARAFLQFVPQPAMPLIAAGFTTAKVLEDWGLQAISVALNPTPAAVAQATKAATES
ncbi:uroporphyrinogen-III synthase [Rhodoluna sp.]|uniref:uroporphyrinogen-III synthase n=1 Tax=Rhodoluna sp. TaxID=1969481 RepID=UPI0025E06E60|nr:uroporphyrinogen-III synthase [Rhodoluna sp.]